MLRRLIPLVLLLPLSLPAVAAAPADLAAELMAETGTVAVLAHPRAQAALSDPNPFLGDTSRPRRERLLREVGLRAWLPPRVWALEARREGEAESWVPVSSALADRAAARGYTMVTTPPLPAAVAALGFLKPGQPSGALPELLGAYNADSLLLLRGDDWSLWSGELAFRGTLPTGSDLLPDLVAETLAVPQQWPEARGRTVLQVDGVNGVAELAGVQAALQARPELRQVQLIRVAGGTAWFAVATVGREALAGLLDAEPRLPAVVSAPRGAPAAAIQAGRLVPAPLLRRWKPEAQPPAIPAAPASVPGALQSPST